MRYNRWWRGSRRWRRCRWIVIKRLSSASWLRRTVFYDWDWLKKKKRFCYFLTIKTREINITDQASLVEQHDALAQKAQLQLQQIAMVVATWQPDYERVSNEIWFLQTGWSSTVSLPSLERGVDSSAIKKQQNKCYACQKTEMEKFVEVPDGGGRGVGSSSTLGGRGVSSVYFFKKKNLSQNTSNLWERQSSVDTWSIRWRRSRCWLFVIHIRRCRCRCRSLSMLIY